MGNFVWFAGQGAARQGEAWRGNAWQSKMNAPSTGAVHAPLILMARQCGARLGAARRGWARQGKER
jgi:hypothetical protein